MIGLLLLKHVFALSDEQVCERWVYDPYFQYFTGEEFFQHAFPHERSGRQVGAAVSRELADGASGRRLAQQGLGAGHGRHASNEESNCSGCGTNLSESIIPAKIEIFYIGHDIVTHSRGCSVPACIFEAAGDRRLVALVCRQRAEVYLLALVFFFNLLPSANSIRRRIASEREGLSSCCLAQLSIADVIAGGSRTVKTGSCPVAGRPRFFCVTAIDFLVIICNT